MPPRTPEETTSRRINNLIGVFAVSVFFFFVSWMLGRGSPDTASQWLLWFFGVLWGEPGRLDRVVGHPRGQARQADEVNAAQV